MTTSLPRADGAVTDNNIVDMRDIPNLSGAFTALGGSVRFICKNPPFNPKLWRVYMQSFVTAPENAPMLWFKELTPQIVRYVITLASGGRIDSSTNANARARERMYGSGSLYFDPQSIDVLYDTYSGFDVLPPRGEDLKANQLALGRRPDIVGHDYNWNQNFTKL